MKKMLTVGCKWGRYAFVAVLAVVFARAFYS